MKLDAARAAKVARLAKSRATSESEVIRAAIDALEPETADGLDLVADLVGVTAGPGDLSTNPKHLEGFGRDHRRHPPHRRAS